MSSPDIQWLSTKDPADRLGITAEDTVLMASPLAHQTGFLYGLMMPILRGTPVVLQDVWRVLTPGGRLILYGPYLEADVETAPGNLSFDESLKSRDPAWGLRDLAAVTALAGDRGLRG